MIINSVACKDCCAGEDAEVPLPDRSTVDDPAVNAYVCSVLASVILDGSTPPPVAAPNTDTGSLLTVGATESPAAVAVTESPVDVGMTGSPAAVTEEVDPVPTTKPPMVAGATESPAAVDVAKSTAPPTPLVAVTNSTFSVIFDIPGVVAGFEAAKILANEGSNNVLAQITESRWCDWAMDSFSWTGYTTPHSERCIGQGFTMKTCTIEECSMMVHPFCHHDWLRRHCYYPHARGNHVCRQHSNSYQRWVRFKAGKIQQSENECIPGSATATR
jgi:hypothetical protein